MQRSDNPTRLWWCPTGPFSFIPLHAAGIYDSDEGIPVSVSDFVVSSYTPSLSALLRHPTEATNASDNFKTTAIIQSADLPATVTELKKIEEVVPVGCLTKLGTREGPKATVSTVLSHLSDSSIVHFACHAFQDLTQPLDSAFIMSDGELKMSQIIAQPMPNASLAFLSACETATGDEYVPDEVMHLAAALLFSGFRSIVGTMW